jgi:hypothetical protein
MTARRQQQTDHRSLALKLQIRRWALEHFPELDLRVWDLCAGEGKIWRALRAERTVAAYTPCDLQPRMPATIKGDATAPAFLDAFDLSRFNVIDLDFYGNPFDSLLHLAPKIRRMTAVFLTHRYTSARAGVNISTRMRDVLDIPRDWPIPQQPELVRYAAGYCLNAVAQTCVVHQAGKVSLKNVDYYALVVEGKHGTGN